MRLETERLVVRLWEQGDRESFRAMNSDPRVLEYYPQIYSHEVSDRLIDNTMKGWEKNGFCLFAVEEKASGRFIGFTGLQYVPFEAHFTPAVEIGWRLAFASWGRGYATEAARAVLDWAFEVKGLKEVVALTVHSNGRSRRVMEKLGMVYDSEGDFENPKVPEGHPLRPHVLYRAVPKASVMSRR